ncbi:DUF4424 family protein [Legionella jamestowniensis]|uniref:DUF4424 domain-containing protein n=1 Tax=Legionella jamestowniensis TaxID=455 RepID=A0A0W0UJ13_9GAMM|nr:DUF4424 family protein [Legionella jamestowniensis]KTD07886.1 hypothetical protein Ljam_2081 [Legionella jamestowniensis]SFL63656.1 protein of unknown function [Legionella jamestowniensis DSM 19215]
MKTIRTFFLILVLSSSTVFANDSTAELAAGGLTFIKNPAIEMRSETLFLSLKKVRVRYTFFNQSDKMIKVTIAFPLPDIESYRYGLGFSELPVDDPSNPIGFVTRVNGQPVRMSIHQQAIAKNKDQTNFLKKNNIPLSPNYSQTKEALKKIPKTQWPKLEALGLIWIDEYDAGQGMTKEPQPGWTLKTVYTWEQIFPAKKTMIIEHEYQPIIGATAGTNIGAPYAIGEQWYKDFIKKYCVNDSLQKRFARNMKGGMAPYTERRLAYILTTGANWAGPIHQFTLTIDKGNKKNLISFCGKDKAKEISDTELQIKEKNFIPKRNLYLLFLIPFSPTN